MLGCDIIEIKRIKKSIDKFGDKFIDRILSNKEKKLFEKKKNKSEFLAGRFAAKESIAKSLKTGIGDISFTDIEILNNKLGAPSAKINNMPNIKIEISISHTKEYAMAVSIIKGEK
jgi:holo-[acyl-carrier protein] synthase